MKKILVLLLCCLLCLTGCSSKKGDNESKSLDDSDVAKELFCYFGINEVMQLEVNVKFNKSEETLAANALVSVDLASVFDGVSFDDADIKNSYIDAMTKEFTETYGFKYIDTTFEGSRINSEFAIFEKGKYLGAYASADMKNYQSVKDKFEDGDFVCYNSKQDINVGNIIEEPGSQNDVLTKELVCSNVSDEGYKQDMVFGFNSDDKPISLNLVVTINVRDYLGDMEFTDEIKEEILKSFKEEIDYEFVTADIVGDEFIIKMGFSSNFLKLFYTESYASLKYSMMLDGYTCK